MSVSFDEHERGEHDASSILTDEKRTQIHQELGNLKNYGLFVQDEQLQQQARLFQERFGESKIKEIEDRALLEVLYDQTNPDSLAYWLDAKNCKDFNTLNFGELTCESATKFFFSRSKNSTAWQSASLSNDYPKGIPNDNAIKIAINHRDQLIRGSGLLNELGPSASDQDYGKVQLKMDEIAPDISHFAWAHKYFSLLYPGKLAPVHSPELTKNLLSKVFICCPEITGLYVYAGRFVVMARECNVALTTNFIMALSRLPNLNENQSENQSTEPVGTQSPNLSSISKDEVWMAAINEDPNNITNSEGDDEEGPKLELKREDNMDEQNVLGPDGGNVAETEVRKLQSSVEPEDDKTQEETKSPIKPKAEKQEATRSADKLKLIQAHKQVVRQAKHVAVLVELFANLREAFIRQTAAIRNNQTEGEIIECESSFGTLERSSSELTKNLADWVTAHSGKEDPKLKGSIDHHIDALTKAVADDGYWMILSRALMTPDAIAELNTWLQNPAPTSATNTASAVLHGGNLPNADDSDVALTISTAIASKEGEELECDKWPQYKDDDTWAESASAFIKDECKYSSGYLRQERRNGKKCPPDSAGHDSLCGEDNQGRIWRRDATNQNKIWYLKSSVQPNATRKGGVTGTANAHYSTGIPSTFAR